eukprot:scaffold1696_cov258-Pinguiococcus_pyrenoidosus.AAC.33
MRCCDFGAAFLAELGFCFGVDAARFSISSSPSSMTTIAGRTAPLAASAFGSSSASATPLPAALALWTLAFASAAAASVWRTCAAPFRTAPLSKDCFFWGFLEGSSLMSTMPCRESLLNTVIFFFGDDVSAGAETAFRFPGRAILSVSGALSLDGSVRSSRLLSIGLSALLSIAGATNIVDVFPSEDAGGPADDAGGPAEDAGGPADDTGGPEEPLST